MDSIGQWPGQANKNVWITIGPVQTVPKGIKLSASVRHIYKDIQLKKSSEHDDGWHNRSKGDVQQK